MMKSNFSFKFFACAMLLAFSVLSGGGCGGGDSYSTNGENPTTLDDVFNEDATVKVGFTFFGEEASATFKNESNKYSLVEKGGSFSDDFDNANAWNEESNFVVQFYLLNGWQLSVASESDNLPAEDVWEVAFSASDETYVDRLRTGVFKTASADFQVSSIVVNNVDIIDTLEPLPYEEPEIPEPTPTPEEPSDDENGTSGGTGGGSFGGGSSGGTPAPTTVAVIGVSLNSTDISLDVGKTATLVATVSPDNATDKSVVWSTSSSDVASVDQSGKVTAVSAGTATITVKSNADNTKSASCVVTVNVATKTVTWNMSDITGTYVTSFTKDGVTITAGAIDLDHKAFMSGVNFTTTLGNFTKIEVTAANDVSGTGWSGSSAKRTWTGNASNVSFSGDIMGEMVPNSTIVFTIEPQA